MDLELSFCHRSFHVLIAKYSETKQDQVKSGTSWGETVVLCQLRLSEGRAALDPRIE